MRSEQEMAQAVVAKKRTASSDPSWLSLLLTGSEDGIEELARTMGIPCVAAAVPEPPLESGVFHAAPAPEKIRAA